MSLFDRLRHLGDDAARQLAGTHLVAQALRFTRLSLFTLAAQLAATGGTSLGWKALAALAVGAAEATVRQLWPAFPAAAVIGAIKGAVDSAHPAGSAGAVTSTASAPVSQAGSSSTAAVSPAAPASGK